MEQTNITWKGINFKVVFNYQPEEFEKIQRKGGACANLIVRDEKVLKIESFKHKDTCCLDFIKGFEKHINMLILESFNKQKKAGIKDIQKLPKITSNEFDSYLKSSGYSRVDDDTLLKNYKYYCINNIYRHFLNIIEFAYYNVNINYEEIHKNISRSNQRRYGRQYGIYPL